MWRVLLMLWMMVLPLQLPAEQGPSLEMLLFLADFVDEQGNWDGPELEELVDQAADSPVIAEQNEVENVQSTDN